MCRPITWVSIFIASSASVPVVGSNQVPRGCPSTTPDELTLLQAAASTKSAATNSADKIDADSARPSDVCMDLETHFDDSVVHNAEPLGVPLVLDSKAPDVIGSATAKQFSALVMAVRAALWLLSLCFFASGAMRWFPAATKPSAVVASCVSTTTDSPVIALAPQCSELLEAALQGDDARCESLLDMERLFVGSGPPEELTAADAWGTTALHAAAAGGSAIVAELFLEFGVHVDPVDAREETPLHIAAREGHIEVCELLAKRGASLRAVNAENLTPLAVAGCAGQAKACRRLLALGAGVEGLPDEEMPDMLFELLEERQAAAPPSKSSRGAIAAYPACLYAI